MTKISKKSPKKGVKAFKSRKLGANWRCSAWWGRGKNKVRVETRMVDTDRSAQEFDELVLDDWFHIERMDHNEFWMRVGDHVMRAYKTRSGEVKIRYEYDPITHRKV